MRHLAYLVLLACTSPPAHPVQPSEIDDVELLVTPAPDHAPFVNAIDAATRSIDMTMFHLTDGTVVEALTRAAGRGVKTRVILDGDGLRGKKNAAIADALRGGGVDVRASSSKFSITHEKAMVIDAQVAFITAINLTKDVERTRDLGVVTHAPKIVADVETLFAADWANAETNDHVTPVLGANLVISPTTSRKQLVALIGEAKHDVISTVENLGDPEIERAFVSAQQRGIAVRLIVPACDKNPDPRFNVPPAQRLAASGVAVRLMPGPESAEHPYMHSKMIEIDHAKAYVGSINFSANSTTHARELGVIFANPKAAASIAQVFDEDWARAVAVTDPLGPCGASE